MPCTPNCGSCCDPVSLSNEQAERIFAFGPAQPQAALLQEIWAPIGPSRDEGNTALQCIRYDVEKRACMDYENRPPVCRDFPWYGKEPSADRVPTLSVCGYKAELGTTVLPIVQVT